MKKSIYIAIVVILFAVLPLRTMDTWATPDIRLDVGDTAGANNSSRPRIASIGNYVYAVWSDSRNGSSDIYFNYSIDNGVNWQSSDIRLDTGDTPGLYASWNPRIACTGSRVYVVWRDVRSSENDIYFNYSINNGVSWQSTAIRLDRKVALGSNGSWNPRIACTGSHVYAVWSDYRNGAVDIYFNYSADNGATWQSSDIRLDTGDGAGVSTSYDTDIACTGSHVYVSWESNRNGSFDIYMNYSSDNGATWQTPDIRLDTGTAAGASNSDEAQIACSGNHVYAIWEDYRDGQADVYFNYSADNGATWQPSDIRLDTGDTPGADASWNPRITCTVDQVYVVWEDQRNGSKDIYLNHSGDNGATWQSSALRLDTGDTAGDNSSYNPEIACSGSQVGVVWSDTRNGSSDVYFNYSADNGANWQSSDLRLDTGDIAGANGSSYPHVTGTGGNVYAVWSDYRNGASDIYFNRAVPAIDIEANGSDGPIFIAQSDTLQIKVSLTSNGSAANVDYWLAYYGPSGWYYFDYSSKQWLSGKGVTHQGPLTDINNKKVFQSKLLPGNYTFYFAVDMNMDGSLTKNKLYYDEVKVTVTQ